MVRTDVWLHNSTCLLYFIHDIRSVFRVRAMLELALTSHTLYRSKRSLRGASSGRKASRGVMMHKKSRR